MEDLNDILKEIIQRIESEILEKLSDCGDDWFTSDKVNEAVDIIKEYIKE